MRTEKENALVASSKKQTSYALGRHQLETESFGLSS